MLVYQNNSLWLFGGGGDVPDPSRITILSSANLSEVNRHRDNHHTMDRVNGLDMANKKTSNEGLSCAGSGSPLVGFGLRT